MEEGSKPWDGSQRFKSEEAIRRATKEILSLTLGLS
jgi:hypothetical protein